MLFRLSEVWKVYGVTNGGVKRFVACFRPSYVIGDRWNGVVAQLVERLVRNEKVWGSTPHGSTRLVG